MCQITVGISKKTRDVFPINYYIFPFFIVILLSLCVVVFTDDASKSSTKSSPELHVEGLKFFNEGNYKKAIEVWLKEYTLVPKNPNTANNIGIAYRYLGDYDSAIQYHEESIELNPNFGHAYYSLGLVYYDLEDFEQAKTYFLKAIKLNYYNADVYFSLGQIYRILYDCDKAIKAYKKVIELNPSYPKAHYCLAQCYESSDKIYLTFLARRAFKEESELNSPLVKESLEKVAAIDRKFLEIGLRIILLCIVGFGVPFVILKLSKRGEEFFWPNKHKIIFLFTSFIFTPSPVMFFPLFVGVAPLIYSLFFSLEIVNDMILRKEVLGFFFSFPIASLHYIFSIGLHYVAICSLYRAMKRAYLLYGIGCILISLALFKDIYWLADAGGGGFHGSFLDLLGDFFK